MKDCPNYPEEMENERLLTYQEMYKAWERMEYQGIAEALIRKAAIREVVEIYKRDNPSAYKKHKAYWEALKKGKDPSQEKRKPFNLADLSNPFEVRGKGRGV